MYAMGQHAIMVHARAGIDDACRAHLRIHIHDGSRHDDCSSAQSCVGADTGPWMHHGCERCSGCLQCLLPFPSRRAVAYAHQDTVEFIQSGQQCSHITSHWPTAIHLEMWPSIIEKYDTVPAGEQSGIRNHLAVPTGTEQRQSGQDLLPVNLLTVASPAALMPSRTSTFFTVSHKI